MSTKKGLKAFLLFKNLGFDSRHGCDAVYPLGIVIAESYESAAVTLGGEFRERAIAKHEKEKVIVLPKSRFKPTKEDSEHFKAGEFLEYRLSGFYFCITPDEEEKVIQIMELPFKEQEPIELLKTN